MSYLFKLKPVLRADIGAFVTSCLTLLVLFFLMAGELYAQRVNYESLRVRDRQPHVFIEHLALPGKDSDEMSLVTLFRLENNFLSYRRDRDAESGEQQQFYAEPTIRLRIEKKTNASDNDNSDQDARTLTRVWSERVHAETYEQTRSSTSFVENMLLTNLEAGRYQIESTALSDRRTRRQMTPDFRVPKQSATDIAQLYFIDEQSKTPGTSPAPLMNMGDNVFFGRDHQLVIWVPEYKNTYDYHIEIDQLRIQSRDTAVVDNVMNQTLHTDEFLFGLHPEVYMHNEQPHLELVEHSNGDGQNAFYLLHIPNSTFENAHHRIRLHKTGENDDSEILAKRSYQSLWLDMPVSLLNLDVAVNMMRFIMSDDAHRTLRRSSDDEKERRFHEFWKERDPTPEKEYNELMVEYFRRIDYTYENFTTPQQPGYESDQGQVYIRRGAPNQKEREFPPNQPTREKWHYDDRTYVFEATTGFGDYQLIEQR